MGPETRLDVGVKKEVKPGVLHEVEVIATVILHEHDVGGPEVAEEVLGVEVTGAEALEGESLFLELEGELGVGEGRAETAGGGAGVELPAVYPCEEELTVDGENVGYVPAYAEKRGEMAGRAEGVSGPEFFCDGENDIVGEAGAEARGRLVVQGHGRREG